MYGIAVRQSVLEPSKYNEAGTIPDSRSVRARIKRAAPAIRGEDHPFFVEIADALRHTHRCPTSQSYVTFAGQEGLASKVNGNERCRTGGLNIQARAGQVEIVRQPGCREVAFPGQQGLIRRG